MSGGSMNYLYSQVEGVHFETNTSIRRAFMKHLELVAKALHDIEWVDSGDCSFGDEDEAILAVISRDVAVDQSVIDVKNAIKDLNDALERRSKEPVCRWSVGPIIKDDKISGHQVLLRLGNDKQYIRVTEEQAQSLHKMFAAVHKSEKDRGE
jgi:hypothetical protein